MTTGNTNTGTAATEVPGSAAASARVRVLARIGVVGGLLGVVQAVVLSVWPAQVGDDRFSYPQTPTAAAVAQVTFAAQHVLLVVGLFALLGLARGRLLRVGLWIAAAGMSLLAVQELVAIAAVGAAEDSPLAATVEALYAIPTVITGVGLVLAGTGVLRGGALPGPRWLPLVVGVYVFVVLTPALAGPFTLARIAIGVWMLLFTWLFTGPARV